jgi:hypothetical protein
VEVEKTERGFEIIRFKDIYGESCSLQQSSLAGNEEPGTSAIWLGVHDNRMHLDDDLLQKLLPHINSWIRFGTFQRQSWFRRLLARIVGR